MRNENTPSAPTFTSGLQNAMPSSDPLDILIRSDAWCTRIVLETCTRLTPEQFNREFPIGLGSLHEILTHIVSVIRRWTDRVAERRGGTD